MANLNNSVNPAGSAVSTAADKAKSAINTGMAHLDQNKLDQLNHLKDEAIDKAAVLYEQTERVVRQNPFYFIGGAALLGYFAGMILSSRKQA